LEMGPQELFALAGLQLWSSWSQLPKLARIMGVSHWRPAMLDLLIEGGVNCCLPSRNLQFIWSKF
jgi:hypothetical protein